VEIRTRGSNSLGQKKGKINAEFHRATDIAVHKRTAIVSSFFNTDPGAGCRDT
jgi:hypothetical protein